jgi:hypothetical protein
MSEGRAIMAAIQRSLIRNTSRQRLEQAGFIFTIPKYPIKIGF